MIETSQTLGDIAAAHPAATRVFLRYRLDFCCGGQRSLADACERAGLDPTAIADEIAAEANGGATEQGWLSRPLPALADYIKERYHETLRRDVPALIEAARRVQRVHAAKPDVPKGLAEHLLWFWTELQAHMDKEENILFPMIARGARGPATYMPVRALTHEHDTHAADLARIRALTNDLETPPHACATWRALYDGLAHLESELMEHIHLENNVLFLRTVREQTR